MTAEKAPIAFLSYVHADDEYEGGRLSQFRKRLEGEIRFQTGDRSFHIFQDREDLKWGQNWKARIEQSLDAVTFLIPVITPGFFKSDACRDELSRFLERERQLGCTDLVLPLYYYDCDALNDPQARSSDPLAEAVDAHQWADWRKLRFEDLTSALTKRRIQELAIQVHEALKRSASLHQSIQNQPGRPGSTASPFSPKKEPSIFVVDALHRGDFTTIADAIGAAQPGDRILIKPGLYTEALVIDKPLEFMGDGAANEVIVQSRDATVVKFRTTMGRMSNLSLRQLGGDFNAVDIGQGRLVLQDCDITSQGLACVAIHDGADPLLRRNRIHDGKEAGVFVYRGGLGTIEENDMWGHALSGIEIKEQANPTVLNNRIHDCQGGLCVHTRALGTIEDNDVFGNAVGIEIKEEANPAILKNRIHDNQQAGVHVHTGGLGTIGGNDLFGNGIAGVEIQEQGHPRVRKNRIHDNQQAGVHVHTGGLGTIEDNEIFGNAVCGMAIAKEANPVVRMNRMHDEKQMAVDVYTGGLGTIEDNDVFGNTAGLRIRKQANPNIRQNRIHDCQIAVGVVEEGLGMIEENDISGNGVGVLIFEQGNPTVRNNRIHDGKSAGVYVDKAGQGTVEDNDISQNAFAGIEIREEGNPTVRNNRINANGCQAVWICNGGRGTFDDNDLTGNAKGAWLIAPACLPNVKRSGNKE